MDLAEVWPLETWGLAVVTAIASTLLYRRRQKRWYIIINFLVNISGLLFTLGLIVFAIIYRWW